MGSYTKLGVVGVGFQTAPLEAFVIARQWYRKLAALGVSQWPLIAGPDTQITPRGLQATMPQNLVRYYLLTVPYTAKMYLVTATHTLALDDLLGSSWKAIK